MIFDRTGMVRRGFYVLGLAWSPIFLLDGTQPVLFESGFACGRRLYEGDMVGILGSREPQMLLLTHTHWDHCGTAGYLKLRFPRLKIAASHRAAEILRRPNALKLIRKLSEEVVPLMIAAPDVDPSTLLTDAFIPFTVDVLVKGGDTLELGGGTTIKVVSTPGHTRNHLSYYMPEQRILVATESAGGIDRAGSFITEFLVDYDLYVESIKRLSSLDVEVFCQGHHFVYVGTDEVKRFLEKSLQAAEQFKSKVLDLLDAESGSEERVVQRIKQEQWDTNRAIKQAEGAYLLNLRARVKHLAEKWSGTSSD